MFSNSRTSTRARSTSRERVLLLAVGGTLAAGVGLATSAAAHSDSGPARSATTALPCFLLDPTIAYGPGNVPKRIEGTNGPDVIVVETNQTGVTIDGRRGRDRICVIGSTGVTVYGGLGHDLIKGSEGDDIILGEAGDDRVEGRGGADDLIGGLGTDDIFGGTGDDTMLAGSGLRDRGDGGDGLDLCLSFDAYRECSPDPFERS